MALGKKTASKINEEEKLAYLQKLASEIDSHPEWRDVNKSCYIIDDDGWVCLVIAATTKSIGDVYTNKKTVKTSIECVRFIDNCSIYLTKETWIEKGWRTALIEERPTFHNRFLEHMAS